MRWAVLALAACGAQPPSPARVPPSPPQADAAPPPPPPDAAPVAVSGPLVHPDGPPREPPHLDASQILQSIRMRAAALRRCYAQHPIDSSGPYAIRITISPSGDVTAFEAEGMPEELAKCLRAIMLGVHFPPTGEQIELRYPFNEIIGP